MPLLRLPYVSCVPSPRRAVSGTPTRRRSLLLLPLLLAAAFFLTCAVSGAEAAPKTVGVVLTARVPHYRAIQQAMRRSLEERHGIVPGRDVTFLTQRPLPDDLAWHNAARKLLVYDVEALVVYGDGATAIALIETDRVPVLYAAVAEPGLLRALGDNATGVVSPVAVNVLVENIHRLGEVSSLGIIYSHDEAATGIQAREIARREHASGFRAVLLDINDPGIWHRFADLDAIVLTPSSKAISRVESIVENAERFRLPTAALADRIVDEGIMFSVGADAEEQGRHLADILAQVLSGRPPAEIPVRRTGRTVLEVNLREARENRVTIPFDMILSATRLIR